MKRIDTNKQSIIQNTINNDNSYLINMFLHGLTLINVEVFALESFYN